MTRRAPYLFISAIMAAALATSMAIGGTTVSRCEFKERGNLFVPGVRVCSPTKITDIKIGEQGLTREIFYNDKALMDFAKSRFDLSSLDVSAGVCNRCDGQIEEGDGRQEATEYEGPTDEPNDEPADTVSGTTDPESK